MNNIENRCARLDEKVEELKQTILGEHPLNEDVELLEALIDASMILGEAYVYQDNHVSPKQDRSSHMNDYVEFKKGDNIVFTWGDNKVRKIELKPKTKNRVLYLTITVEGRRRECLAQWCRHATDEEEQLGFRKD